MIRAILFDLDGTLVQSEKLKALAYATAVQRIRNLAEPDPRAIEAYKGIVGASREVATRHIIDELDLEADLRSFASASEASDPIQILTEIRTSIYDKMVEDPQVIRDNQWPHTIGLLRVARERFCRTGLATMSYRKEAVHVLQSLDLEKSLDVILSREDVQNPKPDPEIYLKGAGMLGVPPEECMVLEDSPNGVRAGVAAGMNVIAIATPFTMCGLHTSEVLDDAWIVHEPDDLLSVVASRIEAHNKSVHG